VVITVVIVVLLILLNKNVVVVFVGELAAGTADRWLHEESVFVRTVMVDLLTRCDGGQIINRPQQPCEATSH